VEKKHELVVPQCAEAEEAEYKQDEGETHPAGVSVVQKAASAARENVKKLMVP
jgi:hypothetical protein